MKTSGESDQVYVNSEFAGGSTNTAKFSLYVSPYLVANQGGRYTKHIYIGSQRVVSKIGDFDSYGSDPRRIQYAGSETDGLSVDYKEKYTQQLQVIKDNYATFAVPYNGEDNNDYVDGKGFCCNDGSLEAAQARVMARAMRNNFQEGDSYEKMQFYYHPDHLGSSSYITNLDGEVVQHIEYVPFGEVFVEERNNIWNTPYLFNAKEFDEETGLYYYGARYYEPRLSLWISVDPVCEDGPSSSPYNFVFNNPLILTDPDGLWPIYSKDGSYLGNDGKYEKGKDLAYTGVAFYDKNGKITGYGNLSLFTTNHTAFQTISAIVKHEGVTNDTNEYLWIAHTANNAAKESKTTLYKKLMSGYSSVPKLQKKPLSVSEKSVSARAARAGVISVMSGEPDPTGGATLWDGTDFLAWGLNSPNGTPQNKFEEYKSISIQGNIYNKFLNATLSKYNSGNVRYSGRNYKIPASVFTNSSNWRGGNFYYRTGAKRPFGIEATGAVGRSVFWKKVR